MPPTIKLDPITSLDVPTFSDPSIEDPTSKRLADLGKQSMPKHVAIIMDGNGRWAQQQGKARFFGHRAGVDAVRNSVRAARKFGIESLTLFAFSSENWRRPGKEVTLLMQLFLTALKREMTLLNENGVRLNIIGDLSVFSPRFQKKITSAQALTANNTQMTLNIAFNYGGRWDILQASQQLLTKITAGELTPEALTETNLERHLSMAGQGDVDLMIRTGGDYRISNFILWQAAYAELVFTDTLWPDFNETTFSQAIETFSQRQRRFGLTGHQIEEINKL